jgi:hypothetical protein
MGTDGGGGNEPGSGATISGVIYRVSDPTLRSRTAMTSDAGTVVFSTNESLSARDINDTADAYAWRDGHVSLISSGRSSVPYPNGGGPNPAVTASGNDIFFYSTERLTPADGDTNVDLYDARVNGGFDFGRPAPCSGDGCQVAPGRAPDAPAPASDIAVGAAPQPTSTFSLQKVSAAAREKLAATGKITLKVSASAPATLSVAATAMVARKPVRVASAHRTLVAPGTASLVLMLSRAARAQLAADGKLTVKVLVSDSRVAASQSATLKLTHAKAKPKKTKRAKGSSVKRAAARAKGGRS